MDAPVAARAFGPETSPGGPLAPPLPRKGLLRLSPINERRLANFRANRRGYWSFWIFMILFFVSLFAEFIANDRPFLIKFDGHLYWPAFVTYSETTFGGDFETAAVYPRSLSAEADQG